MRMTLIQKKEVGKRAGIVVKRKRNPIRGPFQRYDGYVPKTNDPDQRPGAERWLGLSRKGDE